MKKFTSLSFMLIIALMMFSSCSKDDDGAPALDLTLLEGTWTVTKTVNSYAGVPETTEDSGEVYTFNADKTYSLSGGWEAEGVYTVSGNSISLTADDETVTYNVQELNANSLTLHASDKMELMGQEFEITETIYLSKAE